jgi:membrane protease YdiL (CAAX protease family)
MLVSIAVFVVYHLGFPEFRGVAVAGPIVAGVFFGTAYLTTRNPLVPILAHVAMHVAAVLHGPAGTAQLPPHY